MTTTERKALKKLDNAFEYLRPRMTGESLTKTPRNSESEAGSILTIAMENIVHAQYAMVTYR